MSKKSNSATSNDGNQTSLLSFIQKKYQLPSSSTAKNTIHKNPPKISQKEVHHITLSSSDDDKSPIKKHTDFRNSKETKTTYQNLIDKYKSPEMDKKYNAVSNKSNSDDKKLLAPKESIEILPATISKNSVFKFKTYSSKYTPVKSDDHHSTPSSSKAKQDVPININDNRKPSTSSIVSDHKIQKATEAHKKAAVNNSSKTQIQFKPEIDEFIVGILNNSNFKSINSLQKDELRTSYDFLKKSQSSLLLYFFEIISQLPSDFFQNINGFQTSTYIKLKSIIQNIQGKMKQAEDKLAQSQSPIKPQVVSPNKRISRVVESKPVAVPEINTHDSNNTRELQEPSCSNGTPTSFVFKTPNRIPVTDQRADHYSELCRQSVDESPDDEKSDDEWDIEEILSNVQESRSIDDGKKSSFDSINLHSLENNINRKSLPAVPRVNFINDTHKQDSGTTTSHTTDSPIVVDDDGWQVYNEEDFQEALNSKTYSDNNSFNQNLQRNLNKTNVNENHNKTNSNTAMGVFHAGIRNDGITGEFDGNNYNHSTLLQTAFKEIFGLRDFRPNQLQVINATLTGYDCFVLMPTGGGKSLCYQLPAMLTEGVTIVISPLKSLILDQVNKLLSLDIPAAHLSGEVSTSEFHKIFSDLESERPTLKLLYVTPEKISASAKLQQILDNLYNKNCLARFVIDEAHCVSQWGHDFRPDYSKLSVLRNRFTRTPMMALTATANPRVRMDVQKQLNLFNCKWFLCSFNRPNLKYIILPKKGKSTVVEVIDTINQKFPRVSGIVYCLSRKDCDNMATVLSKAGIKAGSYHAGLSDIKRETVQKNWLIDKVKVICATIAFGMGIDKPDVRFVIHFSLPKSIEGYYQESGRAGRDGEIATCILYYNYSDMIIYRKMMDYDKKLGQDVKEIHLNNLHRIVDFCENVIDCRRAQQLNYFAEHFTREQCLANPATACDNCLKRNDYKTIDVTNKCIAIVHLVKDLCQGRNRFTLLHIVDILKGSSIKKIIDNEHNKSKHYGLLKSWDKSDIQRLMHKLVIEKYLKEELIFSNDIPQAYLKIGSKIEDLINKKAQISFPIIESSGGDEVIALNSVETTIQDSNLTKDLKDLTARCYTDLLEVCETLAVEKNVKLSSIMNIQAIKAMSEKMPQTEAEMFTVQHVTKANFEKYCKPLLEITQNYATTKTILINDAEVVASPQENLPNTSSISDGTNWSALARESTASSSGASTAKRNRSWNSSTGKGKRFKRGRRTLKAKLCPIPKKNFKIT